MARFIPDASVAFAWRFADEASAYSERLLDRIGRGEEVAVPSHWPLEVINGLVQGKKKGRVTEVEIQRFIADLSSFSHRRGYRYQLYTARRDSRFRRASSADVVRRSIS